LSLRWGIVGPGAIARVFVESLRAAQAGEVGFVCGRKLPTASAFCAELGGEPTADLQALLDDPSTRAVYIATPHPFHHAAARAALRAGKAVLCEKPLTTDPLCTRELIDCARETGQPLVEAWMYRTHPQVARLFELVHAGAIGRPVRVEAHFGFEAAFDPTHRLFAPELGGGGILDVGGYPISFALGVARAANVDGPPRLVAAAGELAPTGVDLHAEATLHLADGFEAHLAVSLGRELGRAARVIGERGTLSLADPFLPEGRRHGRVGQLLVETETGTRTEELVAPHDCFALEALEVARLVAAGEVGPSFPLVGHAETMAIAGLLDAWRRELGAR